MEKNQLLNDKILRRKIILAALKNPEFSKIEDTGARNLMGTRETVESRKANKLIEFANAIIDELNENGL